MRKFYELFTIVATNESGGDFERIFYPEDTGEYGKLPTDTQLQRNFAAYLQKGGKMGQAWGVIMR